MPRNDACHGAGAPARPGASARRFRPTPPLPGFVIAGLFQFAGRFATVHADRSRCTGVDEIERQVMAFMARIDADPPIARDTRLMEQGLLDSINLVRLIQYLEAEFGITI